MFSKKNTWIYLLFAFTLIVLNIRSLTSHFLSNITAFYLPNIWETNILQDQSIVNHTDKMRLIRAKAFRIDPNNVSARFQEFRWLRAIGDIDQAATLLPIIDQYDIVRNLSDYPLLKANLYFQNKDYSNSISNYQLFLARNPNKLPDAERKKYYVSLAYDYLRSKKWNDEIKRYRAGKFFLSAGRLYEAEEQANWLIDHSGNNYEALSWAYSVLAEIQHINGNQDQALGLLEQAASYGRNVRTLALMKQIGETVGDNFIPIDLRNYSKQVKPEWVLQHNGRTCETSSFELIGYDIDTDILNAGAEVVLNLYWSPICNANASQFNLIDIGNYWLEYNFIADNLFINPGFDWKLPDRETTVIGSSNNCCDVIYHDHNSALLISENSFPTTRAAEQLIDKPLGSSSHYIVGGKIKWGDVEGDGNIHAIIGGFWLNYGGQRTPGYNTTTNHLQEFINNQFARETQGELKLFTEVVRKPINAVNFSTWLGVTSPSLGSANVYFDEVFMVALPEYQ